MKLLLESSGHSRGHAGADRRYDGPAAFVAGGHLAAGGPLGPTGETQRPPANNMRTPANANESYKRRKEAI
ncbi:hypothetical protein X754_29230 [Mesorhizobium sp. LNJC403B00]|nr:hypothetical protein X754_29230 [Mesorhizobium sp. LNJC403B00]